jgi:prepilin peptidase CpaA
LSLVSVSAGLDFRYRRIPNWLTYPALLVGLGLSFVPGSATPAASGLGVLTAGGLYLVFWLFRAVGAGDVKLMAAVGAFVGWPDVWSVIVYTALSGGAFALLFLIWAPPGMAAANEDGGEKKAQDGGRRRLLKRRMPYSPAVALGTLLALWLGRWW